MIQIFFNPQKSGILSFYYKNTEVYKYKFSAKGSGVSKIIRNKLSTASY